MIITTQDIRFGMFAVYKNGVWIGDIAIMKHGTYFALPYGEWIGAKSYDHALGYLTSR